MKYSETKQYIEDIGREGLEGLLDTFEEDALIAGLECDIPPADFEEAYSGEFKDDEEFAYETADSLGELNNNSHWPHSCIDWRQAARELMMDYCEDNGYYFRML